MGNDSGGSLRVGVNCSLEGILDGPKNLFANHCAAGHKPTAAGSEGYGSPANKG